MSAVLETLSVALRGRCRYLRHVVGDEAPERGGQANFGSLPSISEMLFPEFKRVSFISIMTTIQVSSHAREPLPRAQNVHEQCVYRSFTS